MSTSNERSATSPRRRMSSSRSRSTATAGPALVTDAKRLQQIIKNLLSNAFKFTHDGEVSLTITPAEGGWSEDHEELNKRAEGRRLRGVRHRHRHLAGQAADHLRSVPAGGRHRPAANMAAPAWAWRSAASCRGCSAARSGCRAGRAKARPSRSICRRCRARRGRARPSRCHRCRAAQRGTGAGAGARQSAHHRAGRHPDRCPG